MGRLATETGACWAVCVRSLISLAKATGLRTVSLCLESEVTNLRCFQEGHYLVDADARCAHHTGQFALGNANRNQDSAAFSFLTAFFGQGENLTG
jgi:hypothetical protein